MSDVPAAETDASDPIEYLASLREGLDREAKKYDLASQAVKSSSVEDASRSILVSLDTAKELTVEIRDSWRSAYEPTELGTAIVNTVTSLAMARLTEWGEAVGEKDEKAAPAASAQPQDAGHASSSLQKTLEGMGDSADTGAILEQLVGMLQEVNTGMEVAMSIVAARSQIGYTGGNVDKVQVSINGAGSITAIEFDPHWLANRSSFEITNETNAAIAAAAGRALSATPVNALAGTPLEKYGAVLNDPDGLARMLLRKDEL